MKQQRPLPQNGAQTSSFLSFFADSRMEQQNYGEIVQQHLKNTQASLLVEN